ncbi:hypothetical protein LMG28614_05731 [Paraburkholderia ultramafica]|uniref:DoxX family protein n=2 Tax=Paraburkholderia ultramafica TaxID=1544867 RepID=A0A6S7C7S9_9BURK|nr:hypothetical protein LMG28614_05731 [Paraburkholderia ultramafica]
MEKYATLAARILIGGMFLASALGMMGAFGSVADLMRQKGIPFTTPLLIATIALWLVGAAGIISGYKLREASIALFIAVIAVTVTIHAPWTAAPAAFQDELNHFLDNLAILGGLLYLATFGPGRLSIGEGIKRPDFGGE